MTKTSRRLVTGAAALALAAALTLSAPAAAQEAPTAPQRPARMLARGGLDLTPEQVQALEAFRQARFKEQETFRAEMDKIRREMREMSGDPQANQAQLDALIDRAAKLRAEREKSAFRDRVERDKIFTPEQLERTTAFRGRLADRSVRRPGRGAMALGRLGTDRLGRFLGPGAGLDRLARSRALRHRPLLRRWRDR